MRDVRLTKQIYLLCPPCISPSLLRLQWGEFGVVIYLDGSDVLSSVAGQSPGVCTVLVCVCLFSWLRVSSKSSAAR